MGAEARRLRPLGIADCTRLTDRRRWLGPAQATLFTGLALDGASPTARRGCVRLITGDPVPTTAAAPGPVESGDHPDRHGANLSRAKPENNRPQRLRTRRTTAGTKVTKHPG